jgi:hypothetical protein
MVKRFLIIMLLLVTVETSLVAQADNPVVYMSQLTGQEELLRKKYLSYMSEVAHGGRARKMEKRRSELISSIQESIRGAGKTKPYKGDITLRDAFTQYWNVLLSIFKEDYHKIIDMEEVAERSYDVMEAYLLIQEKADERREQAYESVVTAYETFAAKHSVTLTEGEKSKVSRKLEQVGKVNTYVNHLFLIYFKSAVQENNIVAAMQANDVNAVEQGKNALLKYAQEGLTRLDTIKPYKYDGSLISACRKVLEFHVAEAEKKIPALSAFLIRAGEFDKIKKSFDAKAANKRTQSDVDIYNKAVSDINKEAQVYNKNSEDLHNNRIKAATSWEQAKKKFMDSHMPYK